MAEQHILPASLPPFLARLKFHATRARIKLAEYFQILLLAYVNWRIRRIITHAVRDVNAPCPACGNRQGEIRWASAFKRADGKEGALVHQCKVCKAAWGEPPIVDYEAWKIDLSEEQTEHTFGVSRIHRAS